MACGIARLSVRPWRPPKKSWDTAPPVPLHRPARLIIRFSNLMCNHSPVIDGLALGEQLERLNSCRPTLFFRRGRRKFFLGRDHAVYVG